MPTPPTRRCRHPHPPSFSARKSLGLPQSASWQLSNLGTTYTWRQAIADFDSSIAKALEDDETFQGLLAQLKEAATAEVTVRDDTPCSKCSCKHIRMVKVPDYKLKLQIMEFLANRGVGRPSQAAESSEERIVFERVVYLGDDPAS